MTITNAIKELKGEGVLVSRQGAGVYVHTDPRHGQGVTFEHALTVHATTDRDDAGTPLQECSVCAALVVPERRERHADWHQRQGE